jgi:FKBP-type peptidyl-prolyl cis-trans isomerase 2
MSVAKGDFVEIVYVGRLDDGKIFDMNDKEVAAKEGIKAHIHDKTIICVGQRDVVLGLDSFLVGKELNKELVVAVEPEEGFGKKEAELIQMIPIKKLNEHKINPTPGMQLNIDNMRGIVKSVSGGRVMIDFNHPLAGQKLHYTLKITRKVDAVAEQIEGLLLNLLHLHEVKVNEKEGKVSIKIQQQLPEQLTKMLVDEIKKRIPQVKEVVFEK